MTAAPHYGCANKGYLSMKTLLAAAAGIALLAGASAASAESYASIGYSQLGAEDSGIDVDFGAVTARVGTNFNPWFGVEGEAAMGVKDPKRKYDVLDLASGDVIVAATGVTDGALLTGVRFGREVIETETIVYRSATGTVRRIRAEHREFAKFHLG